MKKETKSLCVFGVIGFVFIMLTSGCTMAKIYGRGATPVMLNNPPQMNRFSDLVRAMRSDQSTSVEGLSPDAVAVVLFGSVDSGSMGRRA